MDAESATSNVIPGENVDEAGNAEGDILKWKHEYRDLGPLASWTVSSAKPGFGIACVQDESLETYWQSDGPQPHYINIHFPHLISFKYLAIYLNFALDESYTPAGIKILTGMGYHTLRETKVLELQEPKGWRYFDMTQELAPYKVGSAKELAERKRGTKMFDTRLIQLQILSNHQNGKDTHVRGIKVYTPREAQGCSSNGDDLELSGFDLDNLVR